MADHNDFGKKAEDLAADFLVGKGYKILVRNFRFQKAEIDIVAEFQDQIVIVEVKARSTDAFLEPQEAVNKRKIKLLVLATDEFLKQNNIDKDLRFDIISVLPDVSNQLRITHIEDAFSSIDAN